MKIEELRARLEELNTQANDIMAACDGEKRDLTEDERKDVARIMHDFELTKDEIDKREQLESQTAILTQSQGRKTAPAQPTSGNSKLSDAVAYWDEDEEPPKAGPKSRLLTPVSERGKWGWGHFGEFANKVRLASINGGSLDTRLAQRLANPTVFGSEGVGSDGGFAVPPDFRAEIMRKVFGEESLIGRTDKYTSNSNAVTIPKDETTPWQTTGGIQAYWENEGGLKTQSKPQLELTTIRLNKLICLVPVSDELLEDAPMLEGYLRRKASEKMDFKASLAVVQGTGVGQPLGILNAASLVSVAKETSQPADTIYAQNIFKMWSRMYGPLRSQAVWLINQDIEPQLFQMTIPIKNVAGTENVGGSVVYLPANGVSGSPYGTLMGRPVIATQACETLGDKGDIIFANLQQYMSLGKAGGIRSDVSMHLWFDYDLSAFRFVLRIGGQPWWNTAISPRDGNNTLSWAVTLDERA